MNNTFFPDNSSVSARLHGFTESIRIKQTFDEVINIDSKLKTIFCNRDVNKETNVLSKLIVMSLTTVYLTIPGFQWKLYALHHGL